MKPRVPNIRTYQRHARWWVDFRDSGQRYRWPAGDTEKEARTLAARILLAVEEGKFRGVRGDYITDGRSTTTQRRRFTLGDALNDYQDNYTERLKSASFYRSYLNMVRRGLSSKLDTPVDRITPEDIDRFYGKRRREVGPTGLNHSMLVLKAALGRAVERGHCPSNPARAFKTRPPEPERPEFFLSRTEFDRLHEHLEPGYRPLLVALAYTGGRLTELRTLDWVDVDLPKRQVTFRKTKSKRNRTVPIPTRLLDLLKGTGRFRSSGQVFPSPYQEGRLIGANAFRIAVRKAAEQAEVYRTRDGERIYPRPHDLRHTYASWQVQAGASLYKVQKLLGHATLKMTERYSHLAPEHLQDAAAILDRMDQEAQFAHRSGELG